MGISTLLIGFLPTYEQIGIAAPLLLTVLRMIQGLGVGGEWGGAVLLALEYGHQGRRGLYAIWPQAGVPLGLLASTGALAICQASMSPADFLAWGWRVPFYLSGLLIVVGLVIRFRILETPLFAKLKEQNQLAAAPISETLRKHWGDILLVAGARFTENACFYLFTFYAMRYAESRLRIDPSAVWTGVNVAAVVEFFTIPLFGNLSDRFSRRYTYMVGCLFLIVFALPFFALLETRDPFWIALAIVVGLGVGHALLYSVQASLIPELFGTRLRNTGASIGYQLAAPLAGGTAPLIATWLQYRYVDQYWPLAAYIMAMEE